MNLRSWAAPFLAVGLIAIPAMAADYHVRGTGCSNSNPGTVSQPLCTVQAGVDKVSSVGDRVLVHQGTYPECVTVQKGFDGTAAQPITIQGAPGEDPAQIIIDASAAGSCPEANPAGCDSVTHFAAITVKGNWSKFLGKVRIADLTVRPPSIDNSTKVSGISLQCVSGVELLGIRSDQQPQLSTAGTLEGGADALVFAYSSYGVLVERLETANGGTIRPGFHAFAFQGSANLTITESRIRDLDGGFILQSGGVDRVTAMFNDVQNINGFADGENVIQAYNSDNIRVTYNRIKDHGGRIMLPRSYNFSSHHPKIIVTNNYFEARSSGQTAILTGYAADSDAVELLVFRNNLFRGYDVAYSFLGPRVRDCDFVEDNDAFYDVNQPLANASSCNYGLGPNSLTLSQVPTDSNDCPVSTSPIVDGGDSQYATPMAGGGRVDIGACERGESGGAWLTPYDFAAMDSTDDPTPRIDWSGQIGAEIDLRPLDFKRFLKGSGQSMYRCQVDTEYTFSSQGVEKPLWDSGDVSSGNPFCDVPTSLPSGVYYARVSLNDEIWSGFFKFQVGTGQAQPLAAPANARRIDTR